MPLVLIAWESQIGANGGGVLVHLLSEVRREVDDIVFPEIIRGCRIDLDSSFAAYPWWSEVD